MHHDENATYRQKKIFLPHVINFSRYEKLSNEAQNCALTKNEIEWRDEVLPFHKIDADHCQE